MKKLYLALMLFSSKLLIAQSFYDNAPCNTNLTPSSYTFNWKAQNFTYYAINDPNPRTIQSPFYQSSLTNKNVNEFSIYTNKDYNEIDGWNLIKSDFGKPNQGIATPYFLLYNKYTGVLRFFIAIHQLIGQNNAAVITLSYPSGKLRTAHLEHYNQNGNFNSLEGFYNKVAPIQTSNYFLNQANYWFHADFNMNYDPCACNYENSLQFEVSFSQTSNLAFTLEGQALQSFNLNEFTDNFGRIGEKGSHSIAKNISNFPLYSMFKNTVTGINYVGQLYGATSNWDALPTNSKNKFLNHFSGILELAKAGSSIESLISLVTGSSLNNNPQVPLGLNIKLKGQGTITTDVPYASLQLINPGSYQVPIATTYLPEYNNGYGIFNLLTIPTVTRTYAYYDEYDPYDYNNLNPIYTRATSKFKLDNLVKYIINSNAGFDLANSDIKASLVFKGSFGNGTNMVPKSYETEMYPIGCLPDLEVPFDEIRDFNQSPTYVEGWTPAQVFVKIYGKFRIPGTTKDVFYVNTFDANLNYVYDPNYSNTAFPEVKPSSSCSYINPSATDLEVKAVCNSNNYKNKAKEFYRRGGNGEEDIKTDGNEKNASVFKVNILNNPIVNNKAVLSLETSKLGLYNIDFFDNTGRLIKNVKKQIAIAGKTMFEVNLNGTQSKSVGFVKLSNGGYSKTIKIIY